MIARPHDVLGLPSDASAAQINEARRRLAAEHHPDRGGDAARMREINAAADELLRRLAPPDRPPAPSAPSSAGMRIARDVPSFTVEALPAVTFESLVVVASWLGEVLDDDPPYRLDAYLSEPFDCWCRLDVVPDAGASTVSIAVGGLDGASPPDVDAVRDAWIANLNALDWPDPV